MKGFASDNWAGTHPKILDALIDANSGHEPAYGGDSYTIKAQEIFRKQFGEQSVTYFVYNGTGANILALDALTLSFNSVLCSEHAHIQVDECGGFEKHTGAKLIPVSSENGKIYPDDLKNMVKAARYPHQSVPSVISISQVTEFGTVYSLEEIKALAQLAHDNGLFLHVDGARIANAAASLGVDFKTMITDTGVDVLSFGGTKNGLMFGEAVVFLTPGLEKHFEPYRKQGMQLASKMRFIAAQFIALFNDDLWLKNAAHSNKMAQKLKEELLKINRIKISQPVESNGVWAILPDDLARKMQENGFFYPWDESKKEYRLMCSWDTTLEDIERLTKSV